MYKNVMSLALMNRDVWCFENWEEKDCSLNQSVNGGGVYGTALDTPGLLNIKLL